METDEIIKLGIFGVIAILVGFGGSLLLTEDEFKHTFVCSLTEEVGVFYGNISGTGYTAYPYAENRTAYKRCNDDLGNKGVWILLKEYAEMKGLSVSDFLINKEEFIIEEEIEEFKESVGSGKATYHCNNKGCF